MIEMSSSPTADTRVPRFRAIQVASPAELPPSAFGAIVYGQGAAAACAASGDLRLVGVDLPVVRNNVSVEAWICTEPWHVNQQDGVRYVVTKNHLFGVVEVDEQDFGGILAATREAYNRLLRVHEMEEFHVWRIWNYLDAINEGAGDEERYKQFCRGRAEILSGSMPEFPAASAIGRTDGVRRLQLIWVAGREKPVFIENPRQVSAYRYPRDYGPLPPSFARGARIGSRLIISGTASILGHQTIHIGDVGRQTAESITNLREVVRVAGLDAASVTRIKAYLRCPADASVVAAVLADAGLHIDNCCLLQADICRTDLLVEIEGVTGC